MHDVLNFLPTSNSEHENMVVAEDVHYVKCSLHT